MCSLSSCHFILSVHLGLAFLTLVAVSDSLQLCVILTGLEILSRALLKTFGAFLGDEASDTGSLEVQGPMVSEASRDG